MVTAAAAQGLARDSLDAQKRALEAERQDHMKQKSVDEAQRDPAKAFERKRNARACENARILYQGSCGSVAAPRWRNPRCRDAEVQMLENC